MNQALVGSSGIYQRFLILLYFTLLLNMEERINNAIIFINFQRKR